MMASDQYQKYVTTNENFHGFKSPNDTYDLNGFFCGNFLKMLDDWNWDDEERSSTEVFETYDSYRHLSL